MASGAFLQVHVLCPFYRCDTNRPSVIQCEGVEENNKISLFFKNIADKKDYMGRFCMKYEYDRCRVFRAVYEQYRER